MNESLLYEYLKSKPAWNTKRTSRKALYLRETKELEDFFYTNNINRYRLSKILGVSPSAIHTWMRGDISEDRLEELRELKRKIISHLQGALG